MQTIDHADHHAGHEATAKDYILFGGIILGIIAISLAGTYFGNAFTVTEFIRFFMGTFFLVFGIFKLLDLRGFVTSYLGYDIIAKKSTAYAYFYPFLELTLAAGYFFRVPYTDYVTFIVMTIGSVGVLRELLRGSKIKCACLGTYVKLPLTTVSLVEDLAMGVMALLGILKVF